MRFRHFWSGSLALASLNHTCRNLVPTFPQRSPPWLLAAAACGGLRSTPDCRPRRTFLHLSYSYASPCGPALLVTQDPLRTFYTTDRRSSNEWDPRMEGAVNQKQHKHLFAMFQCGKWKFEAVGPPILTWSCYCTSCQEAGRQFEQLASAPSVLDSDSGTGLILYRKDRVQCMMGQQYLEEHRLKPDSPTRRVIAKCCNSAMFLDFPKGHWLSMFRNRFPTGAPPLEIRVMTKERRVGVELADHLPNHRGHSGKFMLKLIAAWIALGLRRPEVTLAQPVRRTQYA